MIETFLHIADSLDAERVASSNNTTENVSDSPDLVPDH
jgi:hypothetical protein